MTKAILVHVHDNVGYVNDEILGQVNDDTFRGGMLTNDILGHINVAIVSLRDIPKRDNGCDRDHSDRDHSSSTYIYCSSKLLVI
jgi:hypothetical protein